MEANNYIGRELRSLYNIMRRKRTERPMQFSDDPATMLHHQTIAFLCINKDKDVFQRDIEQEFEIRRPTATKILQLMERNGLIKRENVSYDARLKKIILTKKGAELYNAALDNLADLEKELTKGLTEDEISFFISILHKIKKNLE